MPKRNKIQSIHYTAGLLVIYLLLLTWVILFKMQFSLGALDHFRRINLIPFGGSLIVNHRIEVSEIYENVLAFVPFGLYMGILLKNRPFWQKLILIAGVSLLMEVLQYILAIGASDVTDLIGNTFGGFLGLLFYLVLRSLCKSDKKTNRIFNGLATIGTIGMIGFLVMVMFMNR